MDINKEALKLHLLNKGKLGIHSKVSVENRSDLSKVYSPGVAEPCKQIYNNFETIYDYTMKGNTVAVISNGSAVLGLGNIGAAAALPVMEGKSILFKKFAGVDAFPICLATNNIDEIINTVKLLEANFGGINLEDIAAPDCFIIEEQLKKEINIPVFHDDQNGTAIVTLAALINALKLVQKEFSQIKVVINGAGAAGIAIVHLLNEFGVKEIVLCDSNGAIYEGRPYGMNEIKHEISKQTNRSKRSGTLSDVIVNADVFIGVSIGGVLFKEMIQNMNKNPIIFALANPIPEIMPNEAKEAGASVIGTGRSDFPNQINNVLAFPGIFRGALDIRATEINKKMMKAATFAIASLISEKELNPEYIIPDLFDERVVSNVASAVSKAAVESGVIRVKQKVE